jgi:hypothetical protein
LRRRADDRDEGDMPEDSTPRIGVVLEAFTGRPLDDVLGFHPGSPARNGLLDRRWPNPAEQMPWTFAVPGRGHDLAWWTGLVRAMAGSSARVISIEHEDPFGPAEEGVPEAARLLRAAIDASREVAA